MTVRPQLALRVLAVMTLAAVPVTAFGQGTEEQQQACTPDAVKLCSDAIPDIPKTTACMKAHFSQLSPRCQTAFGEATGGAKPATKTATRKPEAPRAKVATRAERRASERPEREAREPERARVRRPEREARQPMPRADREAALPQREAPDAVPSPVAGFPPFPSPEAPLVQAPSASGSRSQIANACRAGLIDSFTCSTTVPALIGGPAY